MASKFSIARPIGFDYAMALIAPRLDAMAFEPRAQRLGRFALGRGEIRFHIRRWGRRRRPHQLAHDPRAPAPATCGRRTSPQQHGALAEHPPPPRILECHAREPYADAA